MGLFTRNKKESEGANEKPKLPPLPSTNNKNHLPEFPKIPKEDQQSPAELLDMRSKNNIHQLPSFPQNTIGEKFSQNTIKNAVGDEEEEEKFDIMPKRIEEELPKIVPEKVKRPDIERVSYTKTIDDTPLHHTATKSTEPIFVRIDKFENSLKIFQNAKDKITEIEQLLKETKELKEKEQHELSEWENEILQLKMQIEKVDNDIFSKVE